jgi:polypeptide N-acetylgalactosaminyltransferase
MTEFWTHYIYLYKFTVVESDNANEVDGERKKDSGEGVLPLPNGNGKYGEMGKPVVLPSNMSAGMKKLVDEGWQKNAFNQYVSDLISVRRTLPDPRDDWCVFSVC